MRILDSLEIENYKNVPHSKLDDLADLNIIIGPNNCGKTSLLQAIKLLSKINIGKYGYPLCRTCHSISSEMGLMAIMYDLNPRESYLGNTKPRICYSFNMDETDKILGGKLKKQATALQHSEHASNKIDLKVVQDPRTITLEHISFLSTQDILFEIKASILELPEQRLSNYKGEAFGQFISGRRFTTTQTQELVKYLSDWIDPKILDYIPTAPFELQELFEGKRFNTLIEEQGSGTRALICLMTDFMASVNAKIVLLDEPELGLNPLSKQKFLRFLLDEAAERQIFVATHDPTFVNPLLWKSKNVAILLYSMFSKEFVKIDLDKNKEDPETFAGYLPHTTSLKDIQIYVEGTSDVYIFQVFLLKYLRSNATNWTEAFNKVGIYHLGGDFWQHLLYTIPETPYRCLIVLDGDKREKAKQVCNEYNQSVKGPKLQSIEKLEDFHSEGFRAVYCLKKDCLEEYLDPVPPYRDSGYDKKTDGPKIAEKMQTVPLEIQDIFRVLFESR